MGRVTARRLFQEYGSLVELAKALGLKLIETEFDDQNAGVLIREHGTWAMIYGPHTPRHRKAHLLGHFIFDRNGPCSAFIKPLAADRERLIESFAAEWMRLVTA